MAIFEVIQDILYKKQGNLLESTDAESDFVPFMINRWISMHSESNAVIINETANMVWPVMQTKQEWYKFYLGVVPQSKFKKIAYIKKEPKEKKKPATDEIDMVSLIAARYEMSKREAAMYLEKREA